MKRRDDDDGRTVLVIVEDRDVELLAQAALDVKALRCLDVLKVDAAKRRSHELDGTDNLVDVLRVEADGDGINAGKALEQDGLALHDRQAGTGTDVAEAEDGAAIRHDGDCIALVGVVVDFIVVLRSRGMEPRRQANKPASGPWPSGGDFAVHLDLAVMLFMQG